MFSKNNLATWVFDCPCKNGNVTRKTGGIGQLENHENFIMRREKIGNLYYSKAKTPVFHESYFEGTSTQPNTAFILSAPILAILEITGRCNLNCAQCYRPENKRNEELKFDIIKELLSELKSMNVVGVQYIGGEPFLHKDLPEMLKLSKEYGLKTEVISNGYGLTDSTIKECSKLIDGMAISIDGNRETHNRIRQNSKSFESAIQAIEEFSKHGVYTTVIMTLNRENYNEIEDVYSIVSKLGAKNLFLKRFLTVGRGAGLKHLHLSNEDLLDLKGRINHMQKNNTTITTSNCGPECGAYTFFGCPGGRSQIVIDCDGDVYRCLYKKSPEDLIGNIQDTSFREICAYNNKTLETCICPYSDRCGGLCKV